MSTRLAERERMKRFLSDHLIGQLEENTTSTSQPGCTCHVLTLLQADIRNFTTISETYAAAEVVDLLNDYFSSMEKAIQEQSGSIERFIGDALIAVFPDIPNLDSPSVRAVKAAVKMRTALHEFNMLREIQRKFTIENGIGIAAGEVIALRIGTSQGKMEFSIVGKPLEDCGQLESLSKYAKQTRIVVSDGIMSTLEESAVFQELPLDSGHQIDGAAFEFLRWKLNE